MRTQFKLLLCISSSIILHTLDSPPPWISISVSRSALPLSPPHTWILSERTESASYNKQKTKGKKNEFYDLPSDYSGSVVRVQQPSPEQIYFYTSVRIYVHNVIKCNHLYRLYVSHIWYIHPMTHMDRPFQKLHTKYDKYSGIICVI